MTDRLRLHSIADDGDDQDIIKGAVKIQKFIDDDTVRQTYHKLENGLVAGAFQMGRQWYLSKRKFYEGALPNDGAA